MTDDQIIVVEADEQPDLHAAKDSILKLLSEGLTVQVVAARLNLDPSRVLALSDEVQQATRQSGDSGSRLRDYSGQLDELINLAHWQCKAEPIPANIYAYTALIETARGVMQDIDGRRDNAKLTEELLVRVIEPSFKDIMVGLTSKLAGAKHELNSVLPVETHQHVATKVEDILRSMASVLADQLTSAKQQIMLVLNDTKDQKPAQPTNRRQPKMIGGPR